jgi:hypothetical protein
MFSVITNIYNKKTKERSLMEFFTATGKLKFFFDNFRCSICALRVARHTSIRYPDFYHTRVNMGVSIFFTATMIRAFRHGLLHPVFCLVTLTKMIEVSTFNFHVGLQYVWLGLGTKIS